MGKQKKPLTASQVFARIRPTDASGKSGHTADGEAGNKTIGSFTRDSVTIQDTGTRSDEKFELTKVVLPDEDQEACFNTSIVERVDCYRASTRRSFEVAQWRSNWEARIPTEAP